MQYPSIHARQAASPTASSRHTSIAPQWRKAGGRITLAASVAFVAVAGAAAWSAGSLALAIGALGFWHYYLYMLAFRYGAVPLPMFKRDAVLMKSVALIALASAYFGAPLDYGSLVVVAAGFLLNTLAAAALGSDRTYYGEEVANMLRLRATRFPYSVIAHPMLVGNMLAYGGTLLNAGFREVWWPLACAHVALNLGLLAMERHVTPLRLSAIGGVRPAMNWSWSHLLGLSALGALLAAGAAWFASAATTRHAAAVGVAAAVYAYILYFAYTAPATKPDARHPAEPERVP